MKPFCPHFSGIFHFDMRTKVQGTEVTHLVKVTQPVNDQIVSRGLPTCDCGIQVQCQSPLLPIIEGRGVVGKGRKGREEKEGQGETMEERDGKEEAESEESGLVELKAAVFFPLPGSHPWVL